MSDTATLSGLATQPADPIINLTGTGGAAAGGTITFKLYGPDDCTTVAYTSDAVTVSGNGPYSTPNPQFVPTKPGTYHWAAIYSGNLPNNNGTSHNTGCTDTDEDVVVTSVPSRMTTTQKWVPNDSATISASAAGDLKGTVTFTLYPSSDCSGTAVFPAENVGVAGASPQTVGTSNTTAVPAGSYSWKVSYDSDNPGQDDIAASCHETSSLTVDNGGTVPAP